MFGEHKSDFHHFKQMDSQEFLLQLLDVLHEDLNSRGHLKMAATEELPSDTPEIVQARHADEQYRRQNESVIVQLFTVSLYIA